jgi:type II secretory pathway component PulF
MTTVAATTGLDTSAELRRAFQALVPRGDAAAFSTAIESGASIADALREAGASKELSATLDVAKPTDLISALRGLSLPLQQLQRRQAAVRGASLYPFLLAMISLGLSAFVLVVLRPAMSWMLDGPFKTAAPYSSTPALLGAAGCAALLLLLGVTLIVKRPMFPFRRQRQQHDRALLLAAASLFVRCGSTLPDALRAAGELGTDAALAQEIVALAEALDRGQVQSEGIELLGAMGAGLFRTAAARGAGPASLAALAELHESAATSELSGLLLRAQLVSLSLGAFSVTAAGIALMQTYAGTLGGR